MAMTVRALMVTLAVAAFGIYVWGMTHQEFMTIVQNCTGQLPSELVSQPIMTVLEIVATRNASSVCCILARSGMMVIGSNEEISFNSTVFDAVIGEEGLKLTSEDITVDVDGWISDSLKCITNICSSMTVPEKCICVFRCMAMSLKNNSVVPVNVTAGVTKVLPPFSLPIQLPSGR